MKSVRSVPHTIGTLFEFATPVHVVLARHGTVVALVAMGVGFVMMAVGTLRPEVVYIVVPLLSVVAAAGAADMFRRGWRATGLAACALTIAAAAAWPHIDDKTPVAVTGGILFWLPLAWPVAGSLAIRADWRVVLIAALCAIPAGFALEAQRGAESWLLFVPFPLLGACCLAGALRPGGLPEARAWNGFRPSALWVAGVALLMISGLVGAARSTFSLGIAIAPLAAAAVLAGRPNRYALIATGAIAVALFVPLVPCEGTLTGMTDTVDVSLLRAALDAVGPPPHSTELRLACPVWASLLGWVLVIALAGIGVARVTRLSSPDAQ